jgi:hypothetical protein
VTLKSEVLERVSGSHLSRLPELAISISQFDLQEEIRLLRNEESWQRETGRSSKTLVKQQDFRIVLVLMKAGTRLTEHRANARISIHAVLGRIRVHLRDVGKMVELPVAGLLALDFSIPYDVEALEESAFLLTISWPEDYLNGDDDPALVASSQLPSSGSTKR